MDANAARTVLLAIPLTLIAFQLLPLRSGWLRLLSSLAAAALLSFLLVTLLPAGVISYVVSFATMASIYAVLTLGLNVQWGYTGLFNIGIAAFFSVGAFTTALFTTVPPAGAFASFTQQLFGLNAPFVIGVIAGGVVAAIVAWLVGIPTLRLREDYLAMATIGIAELTRLIFQNERWLANGPQPMRGIPQPLKCLVEDPVCSWLPSPLANLFGPLQPRDYIWVYLVVVAIVLFIVYVALQQLLRSPWGRALRAVREDEASAAMVGKNVAVFRMQAFVLGAFVMGVGGALYAHHMVAIDYSHFNPLYATFLIWVMLMLGGSGNNRGAILGAFVIWGVWTGTAFVIDELRPALAAISPALPARAPYFRFLLVALMLIFILLYRPAGLLAEEKFVSAEAARGNDRQSGAD